MITSLPEHWQKNAMDMVQADLRETWSDVLEEVLHVSLR